MHAMLSNDYKRKVCCMAAGAPAAFCLTSRRGFASPQSARSSYSDDACSFVSRTIKLCGRPAQYAPAQVCKLTISSYLFARWHLFRHVGYLRHQQQVDLWPFDLETGVRLRVTCDVAYLCANFRLLRPLCSRLGSDARKKQTSDSIVA